METLESTILLTSFPIVLVLHLTISYVKYEIKNSYFKQDQ